MKQKKMIGDLLLIAGTGVVCIAFENALFLYLSDSFSKAAQAMIFSLNEVEPGAPLPWNPVYLSAGAFLVVSIPGWIMIASGWVLRRLSKRAGVEVSSTRLVNVQGPATILRHFLSDLARAWSASPMERVPRSRVKALLDRELPRVWGYLDGPNLQRLDLFFSVLPLEAVPESPKNPAVKTPGNPNKGCVRVLTWLFVVFSGFNSLVFFSNGLQLVTGLSKAMSSDFGFPVAKEMLVHATASGGLLTLFSWLLTFRLFLSLRAARRDFKNLKELRADREDDWLGWMKRLVMALESESQGRGRMPIKPFCRALTAMLLQDLSGQRKFDLLLFLVRRKLLNQTQPMEMAGLDWSGLSGEKANLANISLAGVHMRDASLPGASFRGVDLRGANLMNSDFRGSNFRGADLTNARLNRARLQGCCFEEANLTAADFQDASLWQSNLDGANLTGVQLTSGQIQRLASMKGAIR